MTFLKITDPKQREALARELQDTKRSIQASNMQHRLDKIGLSRDLSNVFKPVVEAQKEAAMKITKSIEDLPVPVLALPPLQSLPTHYTLNRLKEPTAVRWHSSIFKPA